jgi:carotenoid cleavage dioxygenase-like enzyme
MDMIGKTEIENRIAEIETEEMEMAERQYRYGYMVDKQYSAKLFQEKMQMMKQLRSL